MPIFATSWCLTIFAHDIENLDCVQRLFEVFMASHPLIIIYLVVAIMLEYREELEDNADEYQSSVCFFVFKSPLLKLNSPDVVERIIARAFDIQAKLPMTGLLELAE